MSKERHVFLLPKDERYSVIGYRIQHSSTHPTHLLTSLRGSFPALGLGEEMNGSVIYMKGVHLLIDRTLTHTSWAYAISIVILVWVIAVY